MKKPSRIVALSFAMIKVTFLQIALSVGFAMLGMAATVGSYDQGILDQEFTIHAENKKLEDILGQIEVTAKVKFAFNPKSIPLDREFSRNYQNSKLKTILDNLLKPLGIQYEVFGVFVILSRASDKSSGTSSVNSIPASIVVSGVVRDEHDMELPGANVVEKGTINGVLSDAAGKFTLTVQSEHSILSVSFIGYLPSETVVGGNTDITIKLEPDQKQLDEVVVVGYGEVKKSDLTGSVSSVKSADLNAYPSNNAVLSLSGRAAGVQVIQNNGSPGGAVSVRIRGTNSVQGSNEPLYVVDGFPVNGNPTFLNNSDIESLEILKDASATAIYGNRGANGVVLITTKKGKSGKTTVDYEGSYSIQSVRKKLDMMDAPQFAQFYNEVAANDGQPARYTQAQIDAMGKGTDWQNLVLRNAPLLNQSLTVAGGNDKT
ncbi:MAG TPA: TonB-dependent receptor plug domain-containing protein, partial [Cyclobacteriaceae bacterium]|nr:TonB-dependent receptor plug domain-containing protein [Cyclobacteriaceae bacterium]